MKKKYGYFQSEIGLIEIIVEQEQIISLSFVTNQRFPNQSDNIIIANCQKQLAMYFAKKLTQFNLPIKLQGTPFQELVWSKTYHIAAGTTITYQQLALNINCPQGARAVGRALSKNPLALIIPCHRVINKNKKISNYRYGIDIKKFLLAQEQN